jgi:dienelactone hydrolase
MCSKRFAAVVFAAAFVATAGTLRTQTPVSASPEEIEYSSGPLRLRGFLFRPTGSRRHPAIVFLHGGSGAEAAHVATVGETFSKRSYILFFPYRRGLGPSAGQGEAILDRLNREVKAGGEAVRMPLMAQLLGTEQLADAAAAIDYVRSRPDVDGSRIGVYGHSMGGMLGLFIAERPQGVKAVVSAATAAEMWARNPPLRDRLRVAARNAKVPIFFFQAANDFDVTPTEQLADEMQRSGKTHIRRLYPAWGQRPGDGHMLAVRGPEVWAADVFTFFSQHLTVR